MEEVRSKEEQKLAEELRRPPIKAAGGLLWRTSGASPEDLKLEIAVIHRPRYDDWTIPKGKLVPGESELEGAIREVSEETGYRVNIGRPLGEVSYVKEEGGQLRLKTVRYWSMHAEGGLFSPSREVDQLRWLGVDEALDVLSHERDRDLLRDFVSGPMETRCVLLVRHGSAGNRTKWDGDDYERPLDEVGFGQSEGLVWLLTRFDVREIISAPPKRCIQTVDPLSKAVGLTVGLEPVFAEETYPGRELQALSIIRSAGSERTASVVCSQGGVIPDLLERLSRADAVELPQPIVSKKGSVWSLTFSEGKLVDAEYFPPMSG